MNRIRLPAWSTFVFALLSGYGVATQTGSVTESAQSAYAEGQDAVKKKDYQRALVLGERAVFEIWRGQVDKATASSNLALADLSDAIRLNPKSVLAYVRRADVYARRSEFDKALADCDVAVRLDSSSTAPREARGMV